MELPGTSSNDFGNGSSSKESLDEWRAIRIEQDEAFEESLENDKEKVFIVQLQFTNFTLTRNVQIAPFSPVICVGKGQISS